ncbi:MAG: hypothetical protein JRI23_06975 [Deltaproteobacteria bacterium]|nr:hypothetical protein [Deltaproteobacteria bacterium]MBW2531330.1 hypothetical protein [Deltaproteobacteria bacterium]
MSTRYRKVRNALIQFRWMAWTTAVAGGLLIAVAAALIGVLLLHGVALAAMGALLLAATAPLAARAATLRRQLAQIETLALRSGSAPATAATHS